MIVTTTLGQLERGAGSAMTAGGCVVPMSEVIRLASYAIHYLVVFDEHTTRPLYLGRAKKLASVGQRIGRLARDGGCTFLGYTVGGYGSQDRQARVNFHHHPRRLLMDADPES